MADCLVRLGLACTVIIFVTAALYAPNAPRALAKLYEGLGGAVFTRDVERGERLARRLACGSAFVNAMVRSHPHVPFGGVKASGYGRELGPEGIREFVNVKTLWVGGDARGRAAE